MRGLAEVQDQGIGQGGDIVQWVDVSVDRELALQSQSRVLAQQGLQLVQRLLATRDQQHVQIDIHGSRSFLLPVNRRWIPRRDRRRGSRGAGWWRSRSAVPRSDAAG